MPLDAQAGAVLVLGREVYSKSMGLSVDRGEYAGHDAIVRVISVVERAVRGSEGSVVLAVMDDEVAVQRPVGVVEL